MDINTAVNGVLEWLATSGLRLLASVFILVIGFKIINSVARRLEVRATGVKGDKTVARVLAYSVRIGLKLILIVALIGFVGVDTSGIAALAASLGVSVGLALNGALSNLAGGVLIITTRPFRVDDYIEAEGHSGTVIDIHVTHTRLRTPDNKIVYIPNGALSAANVVNYSESPRRRLDIDIRVDYSIDLEAAKASLVSIASDSRILSDTPPTVRIVGVDQQGIALSLRVWVKNEDYWELKFLLNDRVCSCFGEGILLPSENRVRLSKQNGVVGI